MAKNIIAFFGVNGVGKTTIARTVSALFPDTHYISGSGLLMQALGNVTRETLERISPSEKMAILRPAFRSAFDACASARFAVLDSHLVVPIRRNGTVFLETIWWEDHPLYIQRVYIVVAHPKAILERRMKDAQQDTRKRDLDLSHIERDQEINLRIFEEIVRPYCRCQVIHNDNLRIHEVIGAIREELIATFGS